MSSSLPLQFQVYANADLSGKLQMYNVDFLYNCKCMGVLSCLIANTWRCMLAYVNVSAWRLRFSSVIGGADILRCKIRASVHLLPWLVNRFTKMSSSFIQEYSLRENIFFLVNYLHVRRETNTFRLISFGGVSIHLRTGPSCSKHLRLTSLLKCQLMSTR